MTTEGGYKAVLFSPDGENYVTDYAAPTVEEVWERIDNGGSRWFFYPIPVVVRDTGQVKMNQRVISAPFGLPDVQGRTLATLQRFIVAEQDYLREWLSP